PLGRSQRNARDPRRKRQPTPARPAVGGNKHSGTGRRGGADKHHNNNQGPGSRRDTAPAGALVRARRGQRRARGYCSICLARNPAAVSASLSSSSPIFLSPSRVPSMTAPMGSPSAMMGAMTQDAKAQI